MAKQQNSPSPTARKTSRTASAPRPPLSHPSSSRTSTAGKATSPSRLSRAAHSPKPVASREQATSASAPRARAPSSHSIVLPTSRPPPPPSTPRAASTSRAAALRSGLPASRHLQTPTPGPHSKRSNRDSSRKHLPRSPASPNSRTLPPPSSPTPETRTSPDSRAPCLLPTTTEKSSPPPPSAPTSSLPTLSP